MDIRKNQIIRRRVLREDINNYLQQAIINGNIRPGERIVETRIAKELGVSQAPIREALRELELMGLIETVPFQGAFVKKLSKKDLWDTYQVRALLEGLAAKEAALKITKRELDRLEELTKRMESASQRGRVKEFVELNIAFHRQILEASGNKLLYKLWNIVHLGQWTSITTQITQRSLPELAERHELILEKLKVQDALGAEQSAQHHIQEMMEDILENFEEIAPSNWIEPGADREEGE